MITYSFRNTIYQENVHPKKVEKTLHEEHPERRVLKFLNNLLKIMSLKEAIRFTVIKKIIQEMFLNYKNQLQENIKRKFLNYLSTKGT